ncbi:protein translation factor sui1 homolog 2 [Phtheirospermum japonicum]|uniref:Protein translation factor sui1 homolog 2 n=1 Tax=Phtheirospermum japonicum TaxID=374723 RepID=A0A830CCE9_9LAMI|nr:protein translation factor sui1 homolog 2 [Phtheirospermum japonicum]
MSDFDVQIPSAFAEDSGAGSKEYVHIRIQQRNGRKSLTTVQGLKKEFSYNKILKDLKKEFCCNGTVVQDSELGQVIQLQGDQRKNVSTFLVQAGIVKKEHIKIHGYVAHRPVPAVGIKVYSYYMADPVSFNKVNPQPYFLPFSNQAEGQDHVNPSTFVHVNCRWEESIDQGTRNTSTGGSSESTKALDLLSPLGPVRRRFVEC